MSTKEKQEVQIINGTLELKSKQYITPHYIRITLTGDDVAQFASTTIGVNNKIFIPPAGLNEIHYPTIENDEWVLPPENVRPIIRTYTHRGIDLDKNEMTIDFVAHGESGPASAWAINAVQGDKLGVAMKAGPTELYPQADWYLLVGDATAIPVLGAILETLPATAKGVAYIEVHGKEDEQILPTKADIQINWIYNPTPGEISTLKEMVRELELPEQGSCSRFGYVAAEFAQVKDIRKYLRQEKGWKREELYAYSYWRYGVTEDGSAEDRYYENKADA